MEMLLKRWRNISKIKVKDNREDAFLQLATARKYPSFCFSLYTSSCFLIAERTSMLETSNSFDRFFFSYRRQKVQLGVCRQRQCFKKNNPMLHSVAKSRQSYSNSVCCQLMMYEKCPFSLWKSSIFTDALGKMIFVRCGQFLVTKTE